MRKLNCGPLGLMPHQTSSIIIGLMFFQTTRSGPLGLLTTTGNPLGFKFQPEGFHLGRMTKPLGLMLRRSSKTPGFRCKVIFGPDGCRRTH